MPCVYDKPGIHFLYPDNWTLDEEETPEGARSATVRSPGGAFWSITLHAPATDPRELSRAALAVLVLVFFADMAAGRIRLGNNLHSRALGPALFAALAAVPALAALGVATAMSGL